MYSKKGAVTAAVALMVAAIVFAGCGNQADNTPQTPVQNGTNAADSNASPGNNAVNDGGAKDDQATDGNNAATGGNAETGDSANPAPDSEGSDTGSSGGDRAAMADPQSVAVLINKQFALPEEYEPKDLVYPDVRFTFKDKIEKRMMRKEAAAALEELFEGAEKDGIYLAGVSAYRSHRTQTALFNRYVEKDGEEVAKTYSAVPGHSEHETGLAIDVSGSDGKCAAESCFGDTKEAAWLADHVTEYGFIIRYPEGKEDITGYKYEPWHLRYVGNEIAADIGERNITLEEYYDAVPVSGQ
ncbi:MAG: M15 family metallopeptidase [Paenibacillaceae bacterium]|uniref:M15 family metallopeptidase n=1 Tax=Paenibacillus mellifer TaxID=2937794 RepID=A0A9X1Y1Z8_9BACL|nr:M15 family metallopeptidase [Paenibacillus mellifer]MBW4839257.1 M15 family metallopeptidase [Paenibacillaceae bacterium]MCK8488186.1 M15 family metallopeptidase [Paenibacillus mellifer]